MRVRSRLAAVALVAASCTDPGSTSCPPGVLACDPPAPPDCEGDACTGDPAPPPQLVCPGGGDWCGSNGVQNGVPDTLYHCPGSGQPPTSGDACSAGCAVMPAGTNDFCKVTAACASGGDYCGNDTLGGPASVLFHCAAAGQAPPSWTACGNGCIVEQAGWPDFCAGTCSGAGQTALSWEAGQLGGGNSWSEYCLGFVNNAYRAAGHAIGYLQTPDAQSSLNAAIAHGGFVGWNGTCPCGGILYWSANACNGNFGHVVLCNGDGTVSTSGWPGFAGNSHATLPWLDGQECGHLPAGYILP